MTSELLYFFSTWSQTEKTPGYCHMVSSVSKKHSTQGRGSLPPKPHRVTSADMLHGTGTQSTWVQETQIVPSSGSWESHCENTRMDVPCCSCLWRSWLGPLLGKGDTRNESSWTHRNLSRDKRMQRLGTFLRREFSKKLGAPPLQGSWKVYGPLTLSMSGAWVGIGTPSSRWRG